MPEGEKGVLGLLRKFFWEPHKIGMSGRGEERNQEDSASVLTMPGEMGHQKPTCRGGEMAQPFKVVLF